MDIVCSMLNCTLSILCKIFVCSLLDTLFYSINWLITDNHAGISVLSLDGGDTRGLLPCKILEEIERKTNKLVFILHMPLCVYIFVGI
jgi:hypothetical protein